MSTLKAGHVLLHYRILEKIGEGGMGEVYKAEDTKLRRTVALKVLPPKTQDEDKARRRFVREARAASALNHPNIVTIYAIEQDNNFDFLVMEYVEGETLKSKIEKGAMSPSEVIEIGGQIADALSAAHAAGLIHRDIKASNILMTPQGQAKVLDFGLAKSVEISDEPLSKENTMSRLTKSGMILGTIAYMSPEQTRGEPLDGRTDIFSLGCVLYEAATGKMPFSGPSILSILHEIATAEPLVPSTIMSGIPQGLDHIIQRSLSKDREQRYSSASEMAGALRNLTFANRYQIVRELGRGGMGVVYLAKDPLLDREVAVKVITPDVLSPEAVERFKREARVVAKMDHPAIVGIHDIGEHGGSLFFVMSFVPGSSLRSYLNDQSLSLGEVLDIGIQVADALDYSHQQGVVHRDIKPENILVMRASPGNVRVRVTDFGLAMATTENRLTRTGSVVGTMAYLSPEQLSTKAIDGRTDIYSLGIVLYECVTGHPPFTGEVQSVLYRIAHEAPDTPRMLGADIREEFEEVILRCLEKDPAGRHQNAGEIAELLRQHRSRLRDSDRVQMLSQMHGRSVQMQRPAASPFIGRQKEFTEIQRRMSAAALQSECQFAVIGGEAGIGKTRLLEELENIARGKKIRVLHSRFVEQDQAFPYQGFCAVIQEYFHQKAASTSSSGPSDFSDLATDLITLFPVLAEMAEFAGGQKPAAGGESRKIQDRTYIYDLLARSFVRIGGGKPLAIFLEDLHNADVSLDALQYIVRRLGPTPTLIVGTYRSTEVTKTHPLIRMLDTFEGDKKFLSIFLDTFSTEEHEELLQSLIGSREIEPEFISQIFKATEGNPHFTKELVRSLIDSGRVVKTETGSWNLSGQEVLTSEALPATIQQTVEKRIERLPEEWKEVLSVASVLGKVFEFRDLELLAEGKSNLDDIIDKLIDAGFIEELREARGDQFSFSSGVVRDVLYANLPRRKRRSYHRKYAEQLEKKNAGRLERVLPQLLHHYSEGDVPEKVLVFGMELARKSLDALSPDDALRAAKMVLDFVQEEEGPLLEGEAHLLLAQAHRMSGDQETALREFESAIRAFEKAGEKSRICGATVLAAETAWEGRRVEDTRRWVERGLELGAAGQETDNLFRLLSLAATVANMRGDYDKARKYMEQSERLKPAENKDEEGVPSGGTLVVALPAQIVSIHPAASSIVEESEVSGNVFETLLNTDDQGHLVPLLCVSWESREESKSFRLSLRTDVRMHDGNLLKAADVKTCIEEGIRSSPDRLPAAYSSIRGVAEFVDGTSNHVAGLTLEGDHLLKIDLQESIPIYPALLTDARTGIVRRTTATASEPPVLSGTGPFRIEKFQPDRILLKRSDEYHSQKAHLDSIDFHCGVAAAQIAGGLRSGKYDLASSLLPEDLEAILQDRQLGAGLAEVARKNLYFVLFNEKCEATSIPEVRQVLCSTIRIDDLVRGALGRFAQPAIGLLPPGILGHDPGRRRQVPLTAERATELLKSTGLPLPIRLKASVHPILKDRYGSLTKAIFKIWSELGIEISIATPDMASYLLSAHKNEAYDIMLGRWNADYDDPDNFTHFLFHSRTGNYRYFSSAEVDQLTEEARGESDAATRVRLYRKIENVLLDHFYMLPLFHEIDYRVAGPKIRKLALHNNPPYVNYSELGKSELEAPQLSRGTSSGIVSIPLGTRVMSLDPALTGTLQQTETMPNIFETLSKQGEGARIVPQLASEIQTEEGGARFRFHLRKDVRFHDGRRLTARDVRYSFERLLTLEDSPSRWLLSPIRGAKEMLQEGARELKGFRILSAYEFLIELDQPLIFFPTLLSYPSTAIIPEGSHPGSGNWRTGSVGSGPFRVARFEAGQRLELEANPDYWRPGYPKCEGIVFSFGVSPTETLAGFRAGRYSLITDLFPSDVEALRHDPEYAPTYREAPRLCTYFLAFNIHQPPFSDEEIRHRIVQSIDVEGLVKRYIPRTAIPAHGLIPPGLLGYEPAAGGRTAARTGARSKDNLDALVITHSIFDGPYLSLAKELYSRLEERGFHLRIDDAKTEQTLPMLSPKFDLTLTRWFGDYPDADTFFYGVIHTQNGLVGRFCGTPEVDRLIDRGRREAQPQLRHDIYQEAEKLIRKQALLVPLFHEQTYRFARRELQGFDLSMAIQSVNYDNLSLRR